MLNSSGRDARFGAEYSAGIIVDSVSTDMDFLHSLSKLEQSGKRIPVIALERDLTGVNLTSIFSDNYHGGFMAAKHLVQKGAQHPAHIYGLQDAPWSHDRHDGFQDCLQQKGVYDPQLVVKSDFSLTGGYQAAEQLIHCGKNLMPYLLQMTLWQQEPSKHWHCTIFGFRKM